VGHTCSMDESKLEELQIRYAQLVDILQEHVHGMEDTESDTNRLKKTVSFFLCDRMIFILDISIS